MFSLAGISKGIARIFSTTPKSRIDQLAAAALNDEEEKAITMYTLDQFGCPVTEFINPNQQVNVGSKKLMTLLQISSEHGLFNLVHILLSHGGNPNILGARLETCLHSVCKGDNNHFARGEIVELYLNWHDKLDNGEIETISLNALDIDGNTALHIAAEHGLVDISRRLIEAGIIPSLVNRLQITSCEMADRNGHHQLSTMLELALIFQPNDIIMDEFVDSHRFINESMAAPLCLDCSSLNSQDLENFLQQTITTLHARGASMGLAPLSIQRAESLLHSNHWDVEALRLLAIGDSRKVMEHAKLKSEPVIAGFVEGSPCFICGELMTTAASHSPAADQEGSELVALFCESGHVFCMNCWSQYVTTSVRDNGGYALHCPGYRCGEILPETWGPILLKPPTLMNRLREQRRRHVVDCCQSLKWCPGYNCAFALRVNSTNEGILSDSHATKCFPKSVMCRVAHSTCLSCGDESHTPCSCEEWRNWKSRVSTELSAIGLSESAASGSISDDVANAIWVATNTKKCPRCQAPIEKDEGCNHMSCRKCRHEFCWICMNEWSLHNVTTGGYFQCNRFNVESGDNSQGSSRGEAMRRKQNGQHVAWFLHHFTRYKAHTDSLALETQMRQDTILRIVNGLVDSARGELSWLQSTVRNPIDGLMEQSQDVALETPISELKLVELFGLQREIAVTIPDPNLHGASTVAVFSKSKSNDISMKRIAAKSVTSLEYLRRNLTSCNQNADAIAAEMEFLVAGFQELIKCRLFLRGSYGFSFSTFCDKEGTEGFDESSVFATMLGQGLRKTSFAQRRTVKQAMVDRKKDFDLAQSELEMLVEMLSDIVARRRLRASRAQIIQATKGARSKRVELESLICDWLLSAMLLCDDIAEHATQPAGRHTTQTQHRPAARRNSDDLAEDLLPNQPNAAVSDVAWMHAFLEDSDVETQLLLIQDLINRRASRQPDVLQTHPNLTQIEAVLPSQAIRNVNLINNSANSEDSGFVDTDDIDLNNAILLSLQSAATDDALHEIQPQHSPDDALHEIQPQHLPDDALHEMQTQPSSATSPIPESLEAWAIAVQSCDTIPGAANSSCCRI